MNTLEGRAHQSYYIGGSLYGLEPKGSNSTETLLSRVKERNEIRFLTKDGDTRTFLRRRGAVVVAIVDDARWVTDNVVPLPTVMGRELRMRVGRERLLALEDMCKDALVSRHHLAV